MRLKLCLRGKLITIEGVELPEGNITGVKDAYEYPGAHKQSGTVRRPLGEQPQPNSYIEYFACNF